MAPEGLADLLFEVASPERLVILSRLSRGARSHTELARGLKRSGSETTRHLQRLAAAGLVVKGAGRRYELTTTARVFTAGLGLFEFLVANRDFLLAHDMAGLDSRFLSRLGELGKGTFTFGQYGTVAVQECALREARSRVWIITDEGTEQFLPSVRERASHGIDVRIAGPRVSGERARRLFDASDPDSSSRILDAPGIFLLVVDDRAGICFPLVGGRVDRSAMLVVDDPAGVRWAEDLFLDSWSRARSTRNVLLPGRLASAPAH